MKAKKIVGLKDILFLQIGLVVQLDRISDFGSDGWGFESLLGYKEKTHIICGFVIQQLSSSQLFL